MALDLKSVARNQFASRTSRGLKAGLTKVAGNILGSALGSASPANLPRIGFGGSGPFSVTMLNFPSDVASDPRQGHYINFSVYETVPAKVGTMDNASKKFAAFSGPELMGSMGSADQRRQPTGATGPEILGGGGPGPGPSFQKLVGVDFNKINASLGSEIQIKNSLRLKRQATQSIGTNISLYMPPNISASYNANYTDEPIGAVSETALSVIDAFMEGARGGDVLDNLSASAKKAGGEIAAGITQSARAAILGVLNGIAPGARALYAIEKGQVITPRLELMFNSMG